MNVPHLIRWGFILHLFRRSDTIRCLHTYFKLQLNTKRNLKENKISFFQWDFCKDCKGCKTCNVERLKFKFVNWGKKFFKRKKKKRKCSFRREGKCSAIFFWKNIGANFSAQIFFQKTRKGVILRRIFLTVQLYFLFLFFLWRPFERETKYFSRKNQNSDLWQLSKRLEERAKAAVWRNDRREWNHTAVRGDGSA